MSTTPATTEGIAYTMLAIGRDDITESAYALRIGDADSALALLNKGIRQLEAAREMIRR